MTKIAVVTDLHANREAVEAVFAHARAHGATAWAFLGDFVGYGADPAWVVDQVRELVAAGAVAVCGNHDEAAVIGGTPQMRPEARMVIEWTRSQLDSDQLDFLANLPFQVQQADRLYVHAQAYAPSSWEYVLGRADAVRSILSTSCHYTFCGHVHEPHLYHLGATGKAGEFVPTPEVPIPLPGYRQWLVIPGSAGQPRDGNPAACYAMFEPEAQRVTYHRVPYDHELAAMKIRQAGLPERLAARLHDGL
jgi:diadenosine tetraphosphatase ApaH/serine/threonine PP2A family protein phosphatase